MTNTEQTAGERSLWNRVYDLVADGMTNAELRAALPGENWAEVRDAAEEAWGLLDDGSNDDCDWEEGD